MGRDCCGTDASASEEGGLGETANHPVDPSIAFIGSAKKRQIVLLEANRLTAADVNSYLRFLKAPCQGGI